MSEYKLLAKKREEKGEKVRGQSLLPAVVYGVGKDTVSLSLVYNDFVKLYDQAGESSLIDLSIDGQDGGKILIQEVQYNPVTDKIAHVDMIRIDMNKEITTMISLNFIGEAPAVKEQGGTLVKNIEEIEVRCLPKDLVSEIKVSLESLKDFDKVIRIKDLNIPAGMTITNLGEENAVAKAVPALTEEQFKAMEDKSGDVSQVEVPSEKEEEPKEGEKKEEGKGHTDDKSKREEDKKPSK
ncbi:MAG: 50S ribosomal protein L25 [bacterium]